MRILEVDQKLYSLYKQDGGKNSLTSFFAPYSNFDRIIEGFFSLCGNYLLLY